MKHPSMRLAIAAFILMPFSSCTCQRDTPEPPPRAAERPGGFVKITPRPQPERKEGLITPKAVDVGKRPTLSSETTPQALALPDDFPKDIPLVKDADLMAVQELANDSRNVVFSIPDTEAPKVFTFYKDSMKGSGWDVTQEYQGNDQSFLSFKKGKTITNMSVSKDPRSGKRIVAIMYYEEEALPFDEF